MTEASPAPDSGKPADSFALGLEALQRLSATPEQLNLERAETLKSLMKRISSRMRATVSCSRLWRPAMPRSFRPLTPAGSCFPPGPPRVWTWTLVSCTCPTVRCLTQRCCGLRSRTWPRPEGRTFLCGSGRSWSSCRKSIRKWPRRLQLKRRDDWSDFRPRLRRAGRVVHPCGAGASPQHGPTGTR